MEKKLRNNIMVVNVDPLELEEATEWRTEKKVAERALAPVFLQWRMKIMPLIEFSKAQRSRWQ